MEIQGKSRDETLKDFSSGTGWYRSADVDRLSEEEAGIIAARLVRRMEARTALAQDKAERLRTLLANALRKRFTEEQYQEPLSASPLAVEFLDEKQVAILKQALESGVRPLPNEE
jgi:predicted DNA binding protein